ncbi:MAG: SagB/ThcOx family dehydrogenase [Chloroflexi bacterium]|nr:SagB/ThcOx family dehydrogenase [Chloroflexota bacterium]
MSDDEMPQDPIEKVITRRGSARQFSREPMTFHELSTILLKATSVISADFLKSQEISLGEVYLIVNSVDGLEPGKYVYQRDSGMLESILLGDFRHEAGQLGLGQALAADASVNIYFLTDLESVLNRFGNRGYRAAQLEASITAGRIYLGAYALRLGATGLTFYDDAVTDFFSPHAEGKSVMFLVAVGRRNRRSNQSQV